MIDRRRIIFLSASSGDYFDYERLEAGLPVDRHALLLRLSRLRRFAGAADSNVLAHSVLVAKILEDNRKSPGICLQGLWHDATEAYIGEIPMGVKTIVPEIKAYENRLWRQYLAGELGLPAELHEDVKTADTVALAVEAFYFWGVSIDSEWGREYERSWLRQHTRHVFGHFLSLSADQLVWYALDLDERWRRDAGRKP